MPGALQFTGPASRQHGIFADRRISRFQYFEAILINRMTDLRGWQQRLNMLQHAISQLHGFSKQNNQLKLPCDSSASIAEMG